MPAAEEFKVILVGDSGVGKTTFLIRFADGWFQNEYDCTLGVDYKKVLMEVQGRVVELKVWDTAGQERFRSIVSRFYRSADGVIVMYDVTNKQSFESVPWWVQDVRTHCPSVPIILVGNKNEDARLTEVLDELVQEFAEENRLICCKSSAKNNVNVHKVFESIAAIMLSERDADMDHTTLWPTNFYSNGGTTSNIRLDTGEKKHSCCSYFDAKPTGSVV